MKQGPKAKIHAATASISKPIHNVKEEPDAPNTARRTARITCLHPWKILVSDHAREPSVAAKLRLVARFAALAVLAAFAVVEPIGIEPMT